LGGRQRGGAGANFALKAHTVGEKRHARGGAPRRLRQAVAAMAAARGAMWCRICRGQDRRRNTFRIRGTPRISVAATDGAFCTPPRRVGGDAKRAGVPSRGHEAQNETPPSSTGPSATPPPVPLGCGQRPLPHTRPVCRTAARLTFAEAEGVRRVSSGVGKVIAHLE